MFFVPVVQFDVPQRPADMVRRDHNRFCKEALREMFEEFHRRHWRKRFQLGASRRYGYARRSRTYERRKQRVKGHTIAMLWSGRSRNETSNRPPKIRIGGSAEGGKKGPTATASYRLPFSGGSGRSRGGSQSNQVAARIIKELSRWSEDEIAWAKQYFLGRYTAKLEQHRGRRKRIRMPRR